MMMMSRQNYFMHRVEASAGCMKGKSQKKSFYFNRRKIERCRPSAGNF